MKYKVIIGQLYTPVVIYYKLLDDLCEFSVCFISYDLEHDVSLIHQIQKLTVDIILKSTVNLLTLSILQTKWV